MYMCSCISGEKGDNRDILRDFGAKPEITALLYVPPGTSSGHDGPRHVSSSASGTKHPEVLEQTTAGGAADEETSECGYFIRRSHLCQDNQLQNASDLENGTSSADKTESEMQQVRWRLACEAIQQYPAIRRRLLQQISGQNSEYLEALRLYPEMPRTAKNRFKKDSRQIVDPGIVRPQECRAEELVLDHPRDWPADDLLRGVPGVFMGTTLWLMSMAFGAVHVAGWHD